MIDRPKTIVVLGAALSANKGAASMLQALVDNVDRVIPGARVVSLSTYPDADRAANRSERLEVGALTPRQILFPVFPLALIIGLIRWMGFSGRSLALTRSLREMMDASVVADLSGISFADGRGIPTLVYNTLMTGIPILVGAPVVKCAQALGPFRSASTRIAARAVLPRLRAIVARGQASRANLNELGLSNVVDGADLAFLMKTGSLQLERAAELLGGLGAFVALSPSSVVKELCSTRGVDYARLLAATVDQIIDRLDLDVLILAHSARPGRAESRMNDLPVCSEVRAQVQSRDRVWLIDESLDPAVLRSVIARSEVLLTSRFHAMISGLATGTPTVVVGWSHKYHEVMIEFGLEDYVVPHEALRPDHIADLVESAGAGDQVRSAIDGHLPRIVKQSRESLEALAAAAT